MCQCIASSAEYANSAIPSAVSRAELAATDFVISRVRNYLVKIRNLLEKSRIASEEEEFFEEQNL